MNFTVTISIGRNVNDRPMSAALWAGFTLDVQTLLENVEAEIFVRTAKSEGVWDGVSEDSYTWVASVDAAYLSALEVNLSRLADTYLQDAIALTVGTTTLVTPA